MHIFVEVELKCRVNHKCIWCGEIISRGEKAMYQRGVDDHEFFSDYFHLECHAAMTESGFYDDEGFTLYEQQRGQMI